jgi:hypothetical protein
MFYQIYRTLGKRIILPHSIRDCHRSINRIVWELHHVVFLNISPQRHDNRDLLVSTGCLHINCFKVGFEYPVALNVLPILIGRRSAYALKVTAHCSRENHRRDFNGTLTPMLLAALEEPLYEDKAARIAELVDQLTEHDLVLTAGRCIIKQG